MLYAIMESDLYTLSFMLIKYAHGTNLLVPADSDVDLVEEFNYVKHWAQENRMVINIAKTKEIVFKRPNPRLYITPVPVTEVQQVPNAKLLRVTLCVTHFVLMFILETDVQSESLSAKTRTRSRPSMTSNEYCI